MSITTKRVSNFLTTSIYSFFSPLGKLLISCKVKHLPNFVFRIIQYELIININPSKIKYILEAGLPKIYKFRGFSNDSWDKKRRLYEDYPEIEDFTHNTTAFKILIKYLTSSDELKVNFKSSNLFKKVKRAYDEGHTYKVNTTLNTIEDFSDYLLEYNEIYQNMKSNGFKQEANGNYISVAVTRDKDIFKFIDGRHRFAICKLLEIPLIPVKVKLIHTSLFKKYYSNFTVKEAFHQLGKELELSNFE